MSATRNDETEREEIEMLLPWYVTGRLEPGETAKVEAYLARHPELALQLDLVRAERAETVAANEALAAPSVAVTERVLASLPSAGPAAAVQRALARMWQRSGELLAAPSANAVRWAAVAAALLVAVETVALGTLLHERSGTYQTASGGTQAEGGVAVLVVFADAAKASAISRLLADFDASIVDGPKAGGIYKIRLRTEDRSQAAREALVRRLSERRDVVRSVLPSRD
jgi:anti-sigma factor RsiW